MSSRNPFSLKSKNLPDPPADSCLQSVNSDVVMYLIRKTLISGFAVQIPPEFSVTTLCLANCID